MCRALRRLRAVHASRGAVQAIAGASRAPGALRSHPSYPRQKQASRTLSTTAVNALTPPPKFGWCSCIRRCLSSGRSMGSSSPLPARRCRALTVRLTQAGDDRLQVQAVAPGHRVDAPVAIALPVMRAAPHTPGATRAPVESAPRLSVEGPTAPPTASSTWSAGGARGGGPPDRPP